MELKWLEDFVSLANTRNFSKSAEQRNVTQPAFSRRIRALENWLGTELIDRSTYPASLTNAGRQFRETAGEILRMAQESREEFRNRERRGRALLRFAVLHHISLTFLPLWLKELEATQGPLVVNVDPGNLSDCVQALVDGDCDFMLCGTHEAIPILIDSQRYPSVVLTTETMVPVAPPDTEGRALYSLSNAASDPAPYLAYSQSAFFCRVVETIIANQRAKPNLRLAYENPMAESLKAMALEGMGIAWLPESTVADDIEAGRLVSLGGSEFQMTFDIRLYRSIEKSRPQVTRFWSLVSGEDAHIS